MFAEQKKMEVKKSKKDEIIFDELEAKAKKLQISEEATKKEKKYVCPPSSTEEGKKKKKVMNRNAQKGSSQSLIINRTASSSSSSAGVAAPASPNRSISMENNSTNFVIFEAGLMMQNIVDITTDSTQKAPRKVEKKPLKTTTSKASLGPLPSGPFSQMKEAQEMKRKQKHSFDDDEDDD